MDIRVIEARLRKLNKNMGKLQRFSNISYDEYLNNEDMQAIVERYLQVCIQCCIDIGNYIISRQKLEVPDSETNVFIILAKNKVISKNLADKIKGMVKFRNILVHDYIDIDQRLVYEILTKKLQDFEDFSKAIINFI
ncbi:MAG: hypothetical protein JG764_1117 [Clostridiales bacterium]|nr:hypothetical protein [Clostridiales bacterium]